MTETSVEDDIYTGAVDAVLSMCLKSRKSLNSHSDAWVVVFT